VTQVSFLPNSDIGLTSDIRFSARGVPLVYSTGNTDHGSRDGYSDRPVLRKPFKYEELVAILTRLKLVPVE
jgi:hypothetical protein